MRYINLTAYQRDVLLAIVASGGNRPSSFPGVIHDDVVDALRKLGHEGIDDAMVNEAVAELKQEGLVEDSDEYGFVLSADGWNTLNSWMRSMKPVVDNLHQDDEGYEWVLEEKQTGKPASDI